MFKAMVVLGLIIFIVCMSIAKYRDEKTGNMDDPGTFKFIVWAYCGIILQVLGVGFMMLS